MLERKTEGRGIRAVETVGCKHHKDEDFYTNMCKKIKSKREHETPTFLLNRVMSDKDS